MSKPLNPTDLNPRGYFSTDYQAVLPAGVSFEDALQPEFWSHINSHTPPKLRRFDKIQLIPEDETGYAELVVLASGKGYAKVQLVQQVSFEAAGPPIELSKTDVNWRGPSLKWVVERKSDGERIRVKIGSKSEAESAARDYELVTA